MHHHYLLAVCSMMLSVIQAINIKVTTMILVLLIPQSIQLQAQLTLASVSLCHVMSVHVDQCVSAVRVVGVSEVICLCNTCNHVTEAREL
jgi:hypothetical protein